MLLLEYGTAGPESLAENRVAAARGCRSEPWDLRDVIIATATVELPRARTSPLLPHNLGQPRPGLGRLIAISCGESPMGPFALAMLGVPSRTRAMMQDWIVDAVGTGFVSGNDKLGFPVRPGDVVLDADGDNLDVRVGDDGGTLAQLSLALNPISHELILTDPWVFPVVEGGNGSPELWSISVAREERAGHVDRHFGLDVPEGADELWRHLLDSPWQVAAAVVECDAMTVHAPVQFTIDRDDGWPFT